jgi:hypothetical protein
LAAISTAAVLAVSSSAVGATPAAPSAATRSGSLTHPGPAGSFLPSSLSWGGILWTVSPNGAQGPENDPVTNSSNAVYVDSRGRLHLSIIQLRGAWHSVELRSQYPISYGTYQLIIDSAVGRFSDRTVFGMFAYRPHTKKYTNEIDVENSRFPRYLPPPFNAQYAVQPYKQRGHEHHYQVKPSYAPLLEQFTWYPPSNGKGTVAFETRVGATSHSPLLARWKYYGESDPTDTNMYLYLTLWLNHGLPPTHGTHSIILRRLNHLLL